MNIPPLHDWRVIPAEARAIQDSLRDQVQLTPPRRRPRTVAGVDVSVINNHSQGAVCVFEYDTLRPLEVVVADMPCPFPYVPGLLSFRECPILIECFEKLAIEPDLVLVDGHGIAHPKRMGIATHLGLLLDLPTIGCAKSRLCGHYEAPGDEAGEFTDLIDTRKGVSEIVGAVVRTRDRTNPLFVSPGHRMSLSTAIEHVLALSTGYRLPEPTRRAHQAAAGKSLEFFLQQFEQGRHRRKGSPALVSNG